VIIDIAGANGGTSTPRNVLTSIRRAGRTVIEGDARKVLDVLPDCCVQCVVTSPPYWGVRDYGVAGQIGLQADFPTYIKYLVAAFEQVRRVLKPDGVLWLNIGDVYSSGNRAYRAPDTRYPQRGMSTRPATPKGLKPKDLIGAPWHLAFALQRKGWYLRTEVIWNKTNAMPESVRDRPSRCHEYLFLFAKSERYRFSRARLEQANSSAKRSVWSMQAGRSTLKGHHAVFPPHLVLPCIEAASRKRDLVLDPFCGTGTVGRVCTRVGRHFVGVELSESYARSAVKSLGAGTNWLRAVAR
jgi:site-specific DNA-methyltransferase (adenine-specific)